MPTLHDTTELTKKTALWAALGIAALFLLFFIFRIGISIKNYLVPPGPPPPTVAFGKLPQQEFPGNVSDVDFTYEINTLSGFLPAFPEQMKVYKIDHPEPSLLDLERAKTKAQSIGFDQTPKKVGDDTYQWNEDTPLGRVLTMNTTTNNFTLSSFYTSYPPVMNGENVPDENAAVESAKDFLGSMGLLTSDIDISKTEPKLLTLENGVLSPASSLSTTQIIRVDFYQKDLDNIPMYYPRYPMSAMTFLIGGGSSSNDQNIVDAKYYHQTINEEGQTYPIKKTDEAYEELRNKKGYIAQFFGTTSHVKITDVTLGYYLSDQKQEYALPIFIFHGDNDFIAYVPAIANEWIK